MTEARGARGRARSRATGASASWRGHPRLFWLLARRSQSQFACFDSVLCTLYSVQSIDAHRVSLGTYMQITGTVVCFTVEDVPASVNFLVRHFGFTVVMEFDGFVSLKREGLAVSIVFHRRGLEVLPEAIRQERASGVILALVIADFDAAYARLQSEGVNITLPIRKESWGERLFLVTDPNGVVIELVDAKSVQSS